MERPDTYGRRVFVPQLPPQQLRARRPPPTADEMKEMQMRALLAQRDGTGTNSADRLRPSAALVAARQRQTYQNDDDVEERLKLDMFKSDEPACDNHAQKNVPCPDGTVGYVPVVCTLDSWYKRENSDPARGIFGWNMNVQSPPQDDESIGVFELPQTIVRATVGNFSIVLPAPEPYQLNAVFAANQSLPVLTVNTGAPTADSVALPRTQIPFSNRVYMLVNEWSQCFYGQNGVRYHFIFDVLTVTAYRLQLVPVQGFSQFVFTDPQRDVHGLTVQFTTPDLPLSLPQDVFTNVQVSVSAAGNFLTFTIPGHGLSGGAPAAYSDADRIMIKGLQITNATVPANYLGVLNTYLSNPAGFIVGVGGLTTDQFRLNPDVDVSQFGLAPNTVLSTRGPVTVRVARRRIQLPMRFDCVAQRLTNFLDLSA